MILVTGGAGFIGSNLVDALLEKRYCVRVIDDLSSGEIENLERASGSKDFEFIRGDIRKVGKDLLQDVETVFHEAAQIDVRRSVADPVHDLDVNVAGTLNLLENMRKVGIGKIIYASSGGAVYGNPEYLPCDEKHPTNPISPYGVSKLVAEKYIQVYHELYGMDYVNLRYSNVYGPRQDPQGEAGVISIFLGRILNGEKPIVFGDGLQTRDYLHVHDVVEANLLAMSGKLGDGTFNLGAGKGTSVNDLIALMREIMNKEIIAEHAEERKGEVRNIFLDISKIEKLGFKPKHGLRDGIKSVLEWMGG